MKRLFKLYKMFALQFVKILMQSKSNFLIGFFGFVISQVSGVMFLYVIFKQIPDLEGWSLNQLIFIYGFMQIPKGIDHLFTDYIWHFSMYAVKRGEMDIYLIRPLNPLFQLICNRVQFDALGELIIGGTIVVMSVMNNTIKLNGLNVLAFIIAVISGALIFMSIKLLFATLTFWTKDAFSVLRVAYSFAEFTKYPTSIYSEFIRCMVTYILPFAFATFYPAAYLMGKMSFFDSIGMECLISVIFVFSSYTIFCKGINRYESAGN